MTQCEKVLDYMKTNGSITTFECYNFRCAKKIYFSTEFKKWLDAKIHKQKIEQHKKERMAV